MKPSLPPAAGGPEGYREGGVMVLLGTSESTEFIRPLSPVDSRALADSRVTVRKRWSLATSLEIRSDTHICGKKENCPSHDMA